MNIKNKHDKTLEEVLSNISYDTSRCLSRDYTIGELLHNVMKLLTPYAVPMFQNKAVTIKNEVLEEVCSLLVASLVIDKHPKENTDKN